MKHRLDKHLNTLHYKLNIYSKRAFETNTKFRQSHLKRLITEIPKPWLKGQSMTETLDNHFYFRYNCSFSLGLRDQVIRNNPLLDSLIEPNFLLKRMKFKNDQNTSVKIKL